MVVSKPKFEVEENVESGGFYLVYGGSVEAWCPDEEEARTVCEILNNYLMETDGADNNDNSETKTD